MKGNNTKGVSPIIATVLLLMMTVAAAGGAYFWFTNIQSQMQTGLEERVGQTVKQSAQSIRIAYSSCEFTDNRINVSFMIQNTGTQQIEGSFLGVVQKGDQDLASNKTLEVKIPPNSYSNQTHLSFSDGGNEITNSTCPETFGFEVSISETTDSKFINCSC